MIDMQSLWGVSGVRGRGLVAIDVHVLDGEGSMIPDEGASLVESCSSLCPVVGTGRVALSMGEPRNIKTFSI